MQIDNKIKVPAKAGSLESNDILVMISPGNGDLEINIDSIVKTQYEDLIESTIRQTLSEEGIDDAVVVVQDKGAVDFTIKARVRAAVSRGMGE